MSRRLLATVIALALAAAALLLARSRDRSGVAGDAGAMDAVAATGSSGAGTSGTESGSAPGVRDEDADAQAKAVVWKMVDASRARDVAGYLDCFGGDLRARLDASAREMGESGFADYLGRRIDELKGVALYDVEVEPGGRASLTVEYVFAAEEEPQRLHLERDGGEWRITAANESRREQSLIPYGTPIEEVD